MKGLLELFSEYPSEQMLRENRFVVGLDICNLPSVLISDVRFSKDTDLLYIGMRMNTKMVPKIIEFQKELKDGVSPFNDSLIKVSLLGPSGEIVLNEWYNSCQLIDIVTGPLDYKKEDVLSFYLVFKVLNGHEYQLPD